MFATSDGETGGIGVHSVPQGGNVHTCCLGKEQICKEQGSMPCA